MSILSDFDWKTALKTIAPTVASVFGTPLAGAGVSLLLNAIFPDEDHSGLNTQQAEEKLSTALRNGLSPEQYVAMQTADLAFKQKCLDVGVQLETIASADRDSARHREMEVKDRTPAILAGFLIFGFFAVYAAMAFLVFPVENKDALLLMAGGLNGAFAGVVAYYFGSSAGSARKTAALSRLAGDLQV